MTDVKEWIAADDPVYCKTDLQDNKIVLAAICNAANEPEDTENCDSDEAFLKVTHSEGKKHLKWLII
jgi:hypothetical protein